LLGRDPREEREKVEVTVGSMRPALEQLSQPRQPPLPDDSRLIKDAPDVKLRPEVLAHEQSVHH